MKKPNLEFLKPKNIFHYIKTHLFTITIRASLFFLCISLIFTVLFGLLERDGVFDEPKTTSTVQPTTTPTVVPTYVEKEIDEYIAVNLGSEPLNLNSITAQDNVTKTILRHMLEGLVRLDQDNTVIPGIAANWTTSEDGLVWTFTLGTDSLWQDGATVTAQDFKDAIDLHLDPANNSPYRTQMEELFTSVECPDATTIVFTLKQVSAQFPAILADTQFMPIQKALYEQNAETYGFDPAQLCYNGPWFVVLWTHNQRIVMLKNETYRKASDIALEQLIFISSGTENSKYSNFEAGNYDMVAVTAQEVERYRAGGYTVVDYADGEILALDFNTQDPLLQYASLRQALSLSIDRTAFVNDTLKTGATPIEGYHITTDLPTAQQALETFRTELETARAGAEDPESIPTLEDGLIITIDESAASIAYATALVAQWSNNLGIQVSIEPLSYAGRIEKIQKGTMQITITISSTSDPMPEAPLYYRHSLYATNGRIQNVIFAAGRDLDLYYATP